MYGYLSRYLRDTRCQYPHSSITRSDAACSYNTDYLQEVFASIVEFAQFDNTLGFFAGNEVINDGPSLEAAPRQGRC